MTAAVSATATTGGRCAPSSPAPCPPAAALPSTRASAARPAQVRAAAWPLQARTQPGQPGAWAVRAQTRGRRLSCAETGSRPGHGLARWAGGQGLLHRGQPGCCGPREGTGRANAFIRQGARPGTQHHPSLVSTVPGSALNVARSPPKSICLSPAVWVLAAGWPSCPLLLRARKEPAHFPPTIAGPGSSFKKL